MLRKASEVRYHSESQVAEIVDAALVIAARDEVPEALREAAFTVAATLLAQKHVELEQIQVAPNGMVVPGGGR